MKNLTVLIADDHPVFRKGLVTLLKSELSIEKALEANNGSEVLQLLETEPVDIVLLDIDMPVMSGIEALKIIRKKFPDLKVIMLSSYSNENYVLDVYKHKTNGYLLKNLSLQEVTRCIGLIMDGEQYFSPDVAYKLFDILGRGTEGKTNNHMCLNIGLSKREIEILSCVCEQYSNKEIGTKLFLSENTVKQYKHTLMQKTGTRNSVGLAIFAVSNGIYTLPKPTLVNFY